MRTFTDTELQMKFCEGFTFFPFRSLEQHDTLIYKRYAGTGNLKKLLEWHSKEHDAGHYVVKITKKLRRSDIPAALTLLEALQQANHLPRLHTPAAVGQQLDKYSALLSAYRQDVLEPAATELAGNGLKSIEQLQETVQQFMQEADALHALLKDHAGSKEPSSRRMPGSGDREYLSKLMVEMEAFRELQDRNIRLLEAWKNMQALHDYTRAMN